MSDDLALRTGVDPERPVADVHFREASDCAEHVAAIAIAQRLRRLLAQRLRRLLAQRAQDGPVKLAIRRRHIVEHYVVISPQDFLEVRR
jgi:hypothetical protein